jgi:hypothetical protein
MSDLQNEMNRTVQGFVTQIADLAHRAAIDTLRSAIGGVRAAHNSTDTAGAPNARPRAGRPPGRRSAKRSPKDMEALSERFVAFVRQHPGLRIEQINKQLGTATKDLALPIRKLIAAGTISAEGGRRSTTYFAGKKKASN